MAKYKIKNWKTAAAAGLANFAGNIIWGWQKIGPARLDKLNLRRILVVQLDELGDVLLSTPALHHLRLNFPRAHITVLVRDIGAKVLASNSDVDELIAVPVPRLQGTPANLRHDLMTIKQALKKLQAQSLENFDLGIDLRADIRTIFILKFLKIPVRVSQSIRSGGFWLTHTAPYSGIEHEVKRKLGLVKHIKNDRIGSEKLRFDITKDAESQVQKLLEKNNLVATQPLAVFHIFAGWAPKEWPLERFCALATFLKKKYNLAAVIIGTKEESKRINKELLASSGIYDLTGQADIPTTAALIARARLFIGNDSGPMHLACALQTPTIALFGQSTPLRYGPWKNHSLTLYHQVACSPCPQTECRRKPRCVELITIAEVKEAVAKILT